MAGSWQIRRIHQCYRMGLHSLATEQTPQQMLVDPPQPADAHLLAKLMQHARRRSLTTQLGKPPPDGLFGQLCHEQVHGVGGGQHCQQMRPPKLRGAQSMPPTTCGTARTKLRDKVIGHIVGNQFQQSIGTNRRQGIAHAKTLTESHRQDSQLVLA